MRLAIDRIRADGGTQVRVETDISQAEAYAEDMRDGAIFPPIVVFHNGEPDGQYWLADGFHRLIAAETIGWTEIEADVRPGGQREAILYAVGANTAHGLRRTNRDKRNAVEKMLTDPVVFLNDDGAPWSNYDIAGKCAVSEFMVRKRREELSTIKSQIAQRAVTRGGTTYTMNTGNIGQRSAAEPPSNPAEPAVEPTEYQYDVEDFTGPTPQRASRYTPEQRSEAAHIRYFLGEIDRRLTITPAQAAAAYVGELHSDADQLARVASWLNQFQGELHAEMRRREGLEAAD